MTTNKMDYDYLVIGSGFGGSVAALRLAEKGYSVAVIERGKRWQNADFPKTNWNLRKFIWIPLLRCFGIQAFTFLRDMMILHGCGVGGGSLVYASTHLIPPDEVFEDPAWRSLGDWKNDLAPHYATASQMLGVSEACCLGDTDRMLREIANDMGRGATFHPTTVAIHFGDPAKTVSDPYFGGHGPERAGCIHCGGCMVGCRHNAKNTLDKNYLYLAERRGVTIVPETEVRAIHELDTGGYQVDALKITDFLVKRKRSFRCGGVVAAGGVMGTLPLLMRCKMRGQMPRISHRLGQIVRTNSEALVGSTSRRSDVDYSQGIAIASGFRPDEHTGVEMCRYGSGQDLMSLLCTLSVPGSSVWPRWTRLVREAIRNPGAFLRLLNPFGWSRRSGILLVMQSLPNHLNLNMERNWCWPFSRRLTSQWGTSEQIPKYIPVADEVAHRLAKKMDGDASASIPEVLFNMSTTAHILGGCPMGRDASEGVIDKYGRLFGYENFYIADASAIPVNLGVNPSHTILALSEYFMSHVPEKK